LTLDAMSNNTIEGRQYHRVHKENVFSKLASAISKFIEKSRERSYVTDTSPKLFQIVGRKIFFKLLVLTTIRGPPFFLTPMSPWTSLCSNNYPSFYIPSNNVCLLYRSASSSSHFTLV
jgi:hypothetical protein